VRRLSEAEIDGAFGAQATLDVTALQIAYQTDFKKKLNPQLYPTETSANILELHNSAEYALENAKQQQRFMLAALFCFMEPETAGCDSYNDINCINPGACGDLASTRKTNMADMCKNINGRVDSKCFIMTLRETADGGSRDMVAPWNSDIQEWMDTHNCAPISYHLSYRCYFNLMQWNDVRAVEEWVDMDELFDSVFGFNSMASFNDHKPLECSSLLENDRTLLFEIAEKHAETAVRTFVYSSTAMAQLGAGAADALSIHMSRLEKVDEVLHKFRTVVLLNLFYDGAIQPFREIACALNACIDYHPMHTVVDKNVAFGVFYPGKLERLSAKSIPYAVSSNNGTVHPATNEVETPMDVYLFNVIRDAPGKAAFRAVSGADFEDIEAF